MPTKNPGDLDTSVLPPPAVEEQQLSKRLTSLIREEMSEGTMPFSRFMELALFAPGLGYYSAGKPNLVKPVILSPHPRWATCSPGV